MARPLVVDYLRTRSLQELELEHGVFARFSADRSKVSLNYDQISTKSGDPIAEQCRGLILRPIVPVTGPTAIVGEVEVVAWPMNRFYNYGDSSCSFIDWDDPSIRIYEKLDGTMIVVYWDHVAQQWHAATRSVPEADLPIRAGHMEIGDMTFSQLFWRSLRQTIERSQGTRAQNFHVDSVGFDKELTYVFELTTPYNRIVVRYDEPQVTLIAARHTATGQELHVNDVKLDHVKLPTTWGFSDYASLSRLRSFVEANDPAKFEGIVACNAAFQRCKIKNSAWILSSKAKDLITVSRGRALGAIIKGEIDDVLSLVEDDIRRELEALTHAAQEYMKQVDDRFAAFKRQASDRKEFAQLVISSGEWSAPYFALWEGHASSTAGWLKSRIDADRLSLKTLNAILPLLKYDSSDGGIYHQRPTE